MQTRNFRTWATGAALLGSLSSPCFAGGVRIVERTGTQNFADIQSAVDAASDGAVILVGAGTYPGFVVANKSIAIFGVPSATVQGTVMAYVFAGKTFVMSGLTVAPLAESGRIALDVPGSAGSLRFQNCSFHGADYEDWILCELGGPGADGPPGALVSSVSEASFTGCTFIGGKGQNNDDSGDACGPSNWGGGQGGAGLVASGSRIVLQDCILAGNSGGRSLGLSGGGGPGATLDAAGAFASNCIFSGGGGGSNDTGNFPCRGPGGTGCIAHAAVSVIGCTFDGGCGYGTPITCSCAFAEAFVGGPRTILPGSARNATFSPTVLRDAGTCTVSFHNGPSDRVLLPIATRPVIVASGRGPWLVPFRDLESTALLGAASAGGNLTAGAMTPALAPGPLDPICELRYVQIATQSATNLVAHPWYDALGSAAVLALIDRSSAPDCNANGVNDFVEVLEGAAADANHNLIPDGCPGG